MKIAIFLEQLENFFTKAAGMAMPFIVIGNYFSLVPVNERSGGKSLAFLIISVAYALIYSYFAWKRLW